jgi:hypothetical protein
MLIYLISWQSFRKVYTAINSLHSDGILLVLIKIGKYIEKVLFWNHWNQLNHIV